MKKRILVVDDEKKYRNIFTRVFYAYGASVFRVYQASCAEEVRYHLVKENIDLILLDIRMPKVNGEAMYNLIQQYDKSIKVVIASVYPVEKQRKIVPFAQGYYDKSQGFLKLIEITSTIFANDFEKV